MIDVANKNISGYDQAKRWGNPDYDCSSLVITAVQNAGIPVKTNGATYTGNMKAVFLKCGFSDVIKNVNLSTGSGLIRGDVLLNTGKHTAVYLGNGQLVHASINEKGTVTGGVPGDQTGKEICVRTYYNKPWNCILRYPEAADTPSTTKTYKVAAGDSLIKIAGKFNLKWEDLASWNNIKAPYLIYVGQTLKVSATSTATPITIPATVQYGSHNETVKTLQRLLVSKGYSVGKAGIDGEFGAATLAAVKKFQKANKLTADGIVGKNTWTALLK
jgi:nucleoid-associated protein YgaU